jgi:signal transduction histidine kinase
LIRKSYLFLLFWGLFFASSKIAIANNSEIYKNQVEEEIKIYWRVSKPFIFMTESGELSGIEYDMIMGFKKYYERVHNRKIKFTWQDIRNFDQTIETVSNSKDTNVFGVSAFSITEQRKEKVDFTKPYFFDISVLITNNKVPFVHTTEEFNKIANNLKAITIKGTTYENDLISLKKSQNLSFEIEYLYNYENILKTIEKNPNTFGFIDLPIYLMYYYANPDLKINRLNIHAKRRQGYAFILPKNSPLLNKLNEYFDSPEFKIEREKMITKYFDTEIFNIMETLVYEPTQDIILLSKEKEIQNKLLEEKSLKIVQDKQLLLVLGVLLFLIFIGSIIIVILYRNLIKDHKLVKLQKKQIEEQTLNIEAKNRELEQRNKALITLDNEKNNLIKILAHDLKTPINHIEGMAQLLTLDSSISKEDKAEMLNHILNASKRLSKMITNILDIDALENNRFKILKENTDIGKLVNHVVSSFKLQALNKQISILVSTPHQNKPMFCLTDQVVLTEILENLISNAIKFSNSGSQITVSYKEEGKSILISVKDNGQGISNIEMIKLFSKYPNISSKPTGGEKSIGLGLSIVKKYVELLGGSVWCESELGVGSTFFVMLTK